MMHRTLAGVLIIGLSTIGQTADVHSATADSPQVAIDNQSFNLDTDVPPENLKWSKQALAIADREQHRMYLAIEKQFAKLRASGAAKVVRVSHKAETGVRNLQKLNLSSYLYSLNGYSETGKLVGQSDVFFADEPGVTNRTVYPKDSECIFKDFNFWDYATWFKSKCAVQSESKAKYLQAALQSWISLTGGFLVDASGLITELKYAQSYGLQYRTSDSTFYCLNCGQFLRVPFASFPLEYKKGLWPYKLDVNKTTGKLTLHLKKPNYTDVINQIYTSYWGIISFDKSSKQDSKLFPPAMPGSN